MANANSNVQIHIPLDAADQLLGLTIPQVPVKQMPTPARTIVPNTASASSASLLPAVGTPQGAIQSPVTIPEAEQSALGRIPSALAKMQPKPWSELGGAGKVGRVFKDIAIGAGTEFAPRIMPFIPGTPQNAVMMLGAQTQTLGALGTQGVKEAQVPVLQAQVPSIEAGTALTKAKVPLTEAQAAATKSTGQLTQEHADILRRAADIMSDPAFQKAFQNLGAPGETVAQAGQDFGKIAFSPLGLTPETAPLVSGAGRELAARLEAGRTQKVAGMLHGQLVYANYSPYTQQYTIGGKEEPEFQPMPTYGYEIPNIMASRTTELTNPATGMPETYGYNLAQRAYNITEGMPGAGAYPHQVQSAAAIERITNETVLPLIDEMSKKGELGPIKGRFSDFMVRKVGDGNPNVARLQQDMNGVISMMMGMYGFRRQQAVEEIDKMVGARMTPETLKGALQGILDHAESITGGSLYPSATGGATEPQETQSAAWEPPKGAPAAPKQDGQYLYADGKPVAKSQGGKWVQP